MVGADELASVIAKRHEFVEALLSEPMGKAALVSATDTSRSTVDRAIAELERHDLVVREDGRYRATFTGRSTLATFRDYRRQLGEIERARDVVGALPPDADLPPGALVGATVAPTEPHSFGYPLQQSLDVVRDADRMRGVLSAVTPQYVATLHEAVTETGLVLDLVLTPQVWETVTSVHGEEFRTLFESDTVTLRRTDESVPYAVWTVDADGETTSCVVVYTDAGVEGVLTNDTAATNEWALEVFESYSQSATIPEEFRSTST